MRYYYRIEHFYNPKLSLFAKFPEEGYYHLEGWSCFSSFEELVCFWMNDIQNLVLIIL
jgi:hypothetical protein